MKHFLLLLMALVLSSCGDSGRPKSGGRPFEVLITGGDADANEQLASQLRTLTTEGLPQQEPLIDVNVINNAELTQGTRYARNLIVVNKGDTTALQYERNAFAEPQLLVSLTTQGALPEGAASTIVQLVVRAERDAVITSLSKKHNTVADELARERFGCRLWVPEDLAKMKQGKDFVWLSNDGATSMQNICLMRYAATQWDTAQMRMKTDSMLQANIPGERDSMRMALSTAIGHFEADSTLLSRGLWEMRGDAMGGPYVSRSVRQGDSIVTALAFVYAPGQKKRNAMRRLEAALFTMKGKKVKR